MQRASKGKPKAEESEWRNRRDPLSLFSEVLLAEGVATAEELQQLEVEVRREAKAAVEFGLAAPFPDASEVTQHVYA